MQESRGILDDDNKSHGGSLEKTKQKERHIVSWSQEEDDILREQIRVHGTENWTAIASKFKDKTTRQCRRRWFTYLNSDFKKGGWSPEEDMLLCETQKVFGNRWTEIAKVVSGRTDNAVKNRFNTLCKKKVKHEALAKENSMASYINLNNKRVVFPSRLDSEAGYENAVPRKKTRTNISNATENYCSDEKLARECMVATQPLKHLTVVVAQDFFSSECNFSTQPLGSYMKEASTGKSAIKKILGTFLKKDDPKVLALMQQAEFLSSLADEIKSEKRDLNRESAWMVLQNFLKQNKESDTPKFKKWGADFELKKVKVLVDASSCSNEYAAPLLGQPISYESSPESSEYSTRSTHFFSDALCGEGDNLILHVR